MTRIPSTTPTELKQDVEDGEQITVVDVRQPHEFERGHIDSPGIETINLPLQKLHSSDPEQLLEDLPTEDVVAVCASGNRSGLATQLLTRAGIDAENLEYGMAGWTRVSS